MLAGHSDAHCGHSHTHIHPTTNTNNNNLQTDVATLPLQLVFGAFEAESFGRLGSRRFASEISNFTCQVGSARTVVIGHGPQRCRVQERGHGPQPPCVDLTPCVDFTPVCIDPGER